MYSLPHLYGYEDKLCDADPVDVSVCEEEINVPVEPCNREVFKLCNVLMEESSLEKLNDPYDAVILYQFLRTNILQLI